MVCDDLSWQNHYISKQEVVVSTYWNVKNIEAFESREGSLCLSNISYSFSFHTDLQSTLGMASHSFHYFVSYQKDAVVSFPLYSEALKFAYHGEKMIQTAVRALTLNIYNGIILRSVMSLSKFKI